VEAELLKQAYRNTLKLAASKGLRNIAFPSISTGAYGYPVEEGSRIALATVKSFLENEDKIEKVTFVLFSDKIYEVYLKTAESIFL
jgi:O-acetyl-ADP-ribose deacetylase (regulator of RNase III)